jgi:hypothetical protein
MNHLAASDRQKQLKMGQSGTQMSTGTAAFMCGLIQGLNGDDSIWLLPLPPVGWFHCRLCEFWSVSSESSGDCRPRLTLTLHQVQ